MNYYCCNIGLSRSMWVCDEEHTYRVSDERKEERKTEGAALRIQTQMGMLLQTSTRPSTSHARPVQQTPPLPPLNELDSRSAWVALAYVQAVAAGVSAPAPHTTSSCISISRHSHNH